MQLFLDNGISEKDNVYLKNKAVSEPIAIINAEIARAKAVKMVMLKLNIRLVSL